MIQVEMCGILSIGKINHHTMRHGLVRMSFDGLIIFFWSRANSLSRRCQVPFDP